MFFIQRPVIHIVLHFVVPLLIALVFFRSHWKKAYILMMSTMLVDVDHLWANPIYSPGRCSIGFHFLHTWPAILIYTAMLFMSRLRLLALGLLIHMALDGSDCVWMNYEQKHRPAKTLKGVYSIQLFSPGFIMIGASGDKTV